MGKFSINKNIDNKSSLWARVVIGFFLFLLIVWPLFCVSIKNTYKEHNFTEKKQKIISLAPAITESMYLLETEDKLIANTIYCARPKEALKKEKIGTVIKINIEKIISLKPDLVLATDLTNKKDIIKLKKLGIKVTVFPQASDFEQLCDQFLVLGRITNKEKEAKKIIQKVTKEADAIRDRVKNAVKPNVFIQIGSKPLFTVTKNTVIQSFLDFAGGINIAYDAQSGFYSREEVIKKNPDCIIIVKMGGIGKGEKTKWEQYKNIKAVKNNMIYLIDAYEVCSPTPLSFLNALEEISAILSIVRGSSSRQ